MEVTVKKIDLAYFEADEVSYEERLQRFAQAKLTDLLPHCYMNSEAGLLTRELKYLREAANVLALSEIVTLASTLEENIAQEERVITVANTQLVQALRATYRELSRNSVRRGE